MSQLYDRILTEGVRPWALGDWPAREPDPEGRVPPSDELPRALESFDPSLLEGAFPMVADSVVRYLDQFRAEVDTFDIIVNVAPPHTKMFIEFPCVGIYKERHGLHSWGALIESVDFEERGWEMEGARWGLVVQLIFEPRKGYICGPVARSHMFVKPDGALDRHPDRKAVGSNRWVHVKPPWFSDDPEDNFTAEMEQAIWELMVPVLFSISLMHTRNVTAEPVEPNPRVSARFAKRHGRPLTRHHVLIIDPMKKVLESEGNASGKGLSHAVHTCRGHFKRYGEDAPLFGRYTGTWWWAEQRRGNPALGEVTHSYRVDLPGFGTTYRRANEDPPQLSAAEHRGTDPDSGGRGLAAHNATQNAFADALEAAGIAPYSSLPNEPDYDIGWEVQFDGDGIAWVGEVKSLTEANTERQMRAALAQLLRYRQALTNLGHTVRAAVIAEYEPTDSTWAELLAEHDIALVFPERFETFIASLR